MAMANDIQLVLRRLSLPKDVYLFGNSWAQAIFQDSQNPYSPYSYYWFLCKDIDDKYMFVHRVNISFASISIWEAYPKDVSQFLLDHTYQHVKQFFLECAEWTADIVDKDGGEMP